jgi:hypothetical protein
MSGKFLPIKSVLPAPSASRLQKPSGVPLKSHNVLPQKFIKVSVGQGGIQHVKKI